MKKRISLVLAVIFVVTALAGFSLAWERGTHAFIADYLKKAGGPYNIDEIYGAMAPDVFNYMFLPPNILFRDYLYDQTHHHFMKVRDAVNWGYEKSSAYGFLSHNNIWGADSTAHIASRTLLPGEGYVITKAAVLNGILLGIPEYAALLGGANQPIALEICHNIVEAAGDIVLVRFDPSVGANLVEIASRPKPHMQNLMARAYAQGLADESASLGFPLTVAEADLLIRNEEQNFRNSCIAYGFLLQQEESIILENVIQEFKQLAQVYLVANGIPVPPDPMLEALLGASFSGAIAIIEGDYMPEIMATIAMVKRNMVKEGK
jgi:hypothetical protein